MNNYHLLNELIKQLDITIQTYYNQINNSKAKLVIDKFKAIYKVIKNEIEKIKVIKKMEYEFQNLILINEKNDNMLSYLNKGIKQAVEKLKENNNILKITSTNRIISQYNLLPRDIINLTLRINTNYSFPINYSINDRLPQVYKSPYPSEEELKYSFLKFSSDKLKEPIIRPYETIVKTGSILEISYPDIDETNIFYKYTLDPDIVPSYFSGDLYDSNNPFILKENTYIKICSCKFGMIDSNIITMNYIVSEEIADNSENLIVRKGVEYVEEAIRPQVEVNVNESGYMPVFITLDDEISAHCTPNSIHQISLHKRESNLFNDDGL